MNKINLELVKSYSRHQASYGIENFEADPIQFEKANLQNRLSQKPYKLMTKAALFGLAFTGGLLLAGGNSQAAVVLEDGTIIAPNSHKVAQKKANEKKQPEKKKKESSSKKTTSKKSTDKKSTTKKSPSVKKEVDKIEKKLTDNGKHKYKNSKKDAEELYKVSQQIKAEEKARKEKADKKKEQKEQAKKKKLKAFNETYKVVPSGTTYPAVTVVKKETAKKEDKNKEETSKKKASSTKKTTTKKSPSVQKKIDKIEKTLTNNGKNKYKNSKKDAEELYKVSQQIKEEEKARKLKAEKKKEQEKKEKQAKEEKRQKAVKAFNEKYKVVPSGTTYPAVIVVKKETAKKEDTKKEQTSKKKASITKKSPSVQKKIDKIENVLTNNGKNKYKNSKKDAEELYKVSQQIKEEEKARKLKAEKKKEQEKKEKKKKEEKRQKAIKEFNEKYEIVPSGTTYPAVKIVKKETVNKKTSKDHAYSTKKPILKQSPKVKKTKENEPKTFLGCLEQIKDPESRVAQAKVSQCKAKFKLTAENKKSLSKKVKTQTPNKKEVTKVLAKKKIVSTSQKKSTTKDTDKKVEVKALPKKTSSVSETKSPKLVLATTTVVDKKQTGSGMEEKKQTGFGIVEKKQSGVVIIDKKQGGSGTLQPSKTNVETSTDKSTTSTPDKSVKVPVNKDTKVNDSLTKKETATSKNDGNSDVQVKSGSNNSSEKNTQVVVTKKPSTSTVVTVSGTQSNNTSSKKSTSVSKGKSETTEPTVTIQNGKPKTMNGGTLPKTAGDEVGGALYSGALAAIGGAYLLARRQKRKSPILTTKNSI